MPTTNTPLRYPGGKSRLSNFIKRVLSLNNLEGGGYVEPFAGGAGVAITLLTHQCVDEIHINDFDFAVYAFWHSVLFETDELCRRIEKTSVNMDSWIEQREIFGSKNRHSIIDTGFSTFFLNRTNRSGILSGGVIGGKAQNGPWKINARYNKETSIKKIRSIAKLRDYIRIYNMDALCFIRKKLPYIKEKTFVYLDPPYYEKGQSLYTNFYNHEDHLRLSALISKETKKPWIVSYDNVHQIRDMYAGHRQHQYSIGYSAAKKIKGSELMVYSNNIIVPQDDNPLKAWRYRQSLDS